MTPAEERAQDKRARKLARGPGFARPVPPVPTPPSSHRSTSYTVVYQPAEKVTKNPDLLPAIREKKRRLHTYDRRDNLSRARRVAKNGGAR